MFDAHVHAGPDVVPRAADDLELGRLYRQAGAGGFVLKAHHESTVGRAASVSADSGLDVAGGLALNRSNGGLSAEAVFASLRSGGRLIWFPTQDAHTQQTAGLPRLDEMETRLSRRTLAIPPVGRPDAEELAQIHLILDMIAEFGAVLCTGHVSARECQWLFEQARARGIRRFLLTHPSYIVPNMPVSEIREFAQQGAYVEITALQLRHQPEMTPEALAEVARAAGQRLILSSDAGQPDSPRPPTALEGLRDRLGEQGLDRSWLHAAADEVPRGLVVS